MNGIYHKLIQDVGFKELQNTLDAEMKRKSSMGINKPVKQAKPVSVDQEDALWTQNHLGSQTPRILMETMIYLCGVHFVVRGRSELRSMTYGQIAIDTDHEGKQVLRYQQTVANKTNQGGLKHRHIKPKDVMAYENTDRPERCIVKLFQKYVSKW